MKLDAVLSDMDLSALLCSKVCHDVISPVGAIANGLEVLEDEQDEEMRQIALDLVRRSSRQASAKLQVCRIAFGAAGSAGSSIETGDAEDVAKKVIGDEKVLRETYRRLRKQVTFSVVELVGANGGVGGRFSGFLTRTRQS